MKNTNDDFIIRNEEKKDYKEVELLTRDAFWDVYLPGCDEHYLVHILREHEDFIPSLDFVIEKDGKIIANIVYTKAYLENEEGSRKEILSFGPLSILPEYQRKGYGKALMEHSFKEALKLNFDVVVIFGNPSNYVSSGFVSCKKHNIHLEDNIFPSSLLVKELREGALTGESLTYIESKAYSVDEKEAEEFDKAFPEKEKIYRTSQEEFYINSHSTIS